MKRPLLLLLAFSLFTFSLSAQILRPVEWSYALSTDPVELGEEVEIIFRATIDPEWYLYASDFNPDFGPNVTEFTFTESNSYELIDTLVSVNSKSKYDELFDGTYTYFKGTGEFRQKIRILKPNPTIIAVVEGQTCSDKTGQCILVEEDFSISVPTTGGAIELTSEENANTTEPDNKITEETATETSSSKEETTQPESTQEQQQEGTNENTGEETPTENEGTVESENNKTEVVPTKTIKKTAKGTHPTIDTNGMLQGEEEESESLWGFMLIAFLSGFAALLTPCVFPMIPMTVSFFTGKGKGKKGIWRAFFYGFSIIAIYTFIGLVFSSIFGADAANIISTHWLPNVIFFIVFIVFAISFFGAFEIVLPSNFVNSVDRQADKGGLVGIFFMALTLAVVSFSCTGPIAGSILFQSASGEFIKPALGMFSFSLAFALPFTLFALFPSWLDTLPKSGGWLNTVKVVLGFVELALAFKFLSVADQVYHWGLLDRPVYIAIWVGITIAMAMYLLGVYRLPNDSIEDKIGVNRLLLGVASLIFVVYLFPGMFGAPLKALSGYLPPQSTHDFDLRQIAREQTTRLETKLTEGNVLKEKAKYSDFLHLPHGIEGYFDLAQAMEVAQATNKPVFIDFTGHGCVNCREMEASVWSETPVLARLKEDFVVAALYVDDRTEVPEDEWITSSVDGKLKKTIGKINADLQITNFQKNAQPYYVLLSPEGEVLVPPVGYDLNVGNFIKFLDSGLEAHLAGQ